MRLPPLFRRENSSAARREREDRMQKALSEGLRTMATMLSRAAQFVEERRLERAGFEKQERFLERTSVTDPKRQG